MRISDWSSDVCSSDLTRAQGPTCGARSTRSAEVAGLRLRPLAPSDEDLYCRLYTDPGVMRHVGPPLARGAASCAFGSLLRQQAIDPPRSRHWVLVSREAGGALGLMAWLPEPGDPGSAEVGVLLAVGAQGRGGSAERRVGEGGG